MKIIAEKLSVFRGEDLVLSDVSFEIFSGNALVISGPNGVGKSTLLRAIASLLPIANGALTFEDESGEFAQADFAELCHYLGADNAMKPVMTVGENLTFWQEFFGQKHLDVNEALEIVGLDHLYDIPFGHLSTGQRRRVAIARLLISYRPIWLLDEPTSGLDAASEKQFASLMEAHLEDGGIIIAATHIPLGLEGAATLSLEAAA